MKSTTDFIKMKENKEPIVMITAYDYPSAKIVEDAGVDIILVGDSLGNVVLGYNSTVDVTLDDMIVHTKAVKRGAFDTFIVTDMPFMTYHSSFSETLENAKRLIQTGGAHALKLEGSGEVVDHIYKLTQAGVPVVGHLGLTPQSVGVLGGYKVQGKDAKAARKLIEDAKQIEAAGAFSIVLELVPEQVAAIVSEELSIPIIGIGAGAHTDGQVLVYHDLIGYGNHRVPKFVKQYCQISKTIEQAVTNYTNDVRKKAFPSEAHTFSIKNEELKSLYGGVRT
ncbi:3-methyl-2-oxobutanoate hydroxymethyltransferase [Pueribacillus sp. YX66]|uniref:3-methyl-2-oxobutanoate hydroxymethyltransferase n=1 Tax=Pueribacillus sp. YX66 TaxID=3229242 RepID=UPI00358D62B8